MVEIQKNSNVKDQNVKTYTKLNHVVSYIYSYVNSFEKKNTLGLPSMLHVKILSETETFLT